MEYQSVLLLINDHDAAALPSGTGFLGSWTLFLSLQSFDSSYLSVPIDCYTPLRIPIYSSFSIILARRAPLSVSLCLSATVYYCTLLLLLTSFQSSPPTSRGSRLTAFTQR
jgi:uncharacterized membrane protein (DUF485 family)